MYNLQRRQYEMLQRVLVFNNMHRDLFPENSVALEVFGRLKSAFGELQAHGVNQLSGMVDARGHTRIKTKAREAVRLHLEMIAKTARLIARTLPRFDEPFQLPRSKSEKALLQAAEHVAARAEAVSDVFIRYAIPPNFIEQLREDIAAVKDARDDRSAARTSHRNATAAIDSALKKGMSALADLDILLANILRDNVPVMAVWQSSRHVKRARKKKTAAIAPQPDATSNPIPTSDSVD